jgi:hypothetical protein
MAGEGPFETLVLIGGGAHEGKPMQGG